MDQQEEKLYFVLSERKWLLSDLNFRIMGCCLYPFEEMTDCWQLAGKMGCKFALRCMISSVRIVDYKRRKPLALLPNHSGEVNGVCYGKDNTLFSGGGDSRIMGWDIYKNGNR